MVTPQGFNALLKIVEEPPEHVKFVFATTEPDKVIGTIRSRTHHYPFRLVPPLRLQDYLAELCEAESVAVEPGVLSFVVRAGGGSVRDSLSVLDQLIAGSGERGLTYESAAALLGFTDGELLDATVDGLAAGSSATVFKQIDKVIESGHDPRRFVEDVLERLRDLIVVAAIPDGASSVLRGVPEDQLERMRQQAAAFGPGALSRAADIVNAGLTEMSGATAPRLQLELICARVLLPGASGESGYAARLDRLERRLDVGGSPTTQPQAPAPRSPSRRPGSCARHAARGWPRPVLRARVAPRGASRSRTDRRRMGRSRTGAQQAAARAVGAGAAPRAGSSGAGAPGRATRGRDDRAAGASGRPAGAGATRRAAAGTDRRVRQPEPGGGAHRCGTPALRHARRHRHRRHPALVARRAGQDLLDQAGDVDVPVRARAGPRLRRPAAAAGHLDDRAGQHLPQGPARRAGAAGADRGARRRRRRRGHPDARLRDRR